jgi:folate-binding Fe-S cluster repair protein YgfZ
LGAFNKQVSNNKIIHTDSDVSYNQTSGLTSMKIVSKKTVISENKPQLEGVEKSNKDSASTTLDRRAKNKRSRYNKHLINRKSTTAS